MISRLFFSHDSILRNNHLIGTLNISSNYSNQLQLVDLQYNSIETFKERPGYNFQLILVGNPYCRGGNIKYCSNTTSSILYSTSTRNCLPTQCSADQVSSPTCKCAYPYTGILVFMAPSFSNLAISSVYALLEQSLVDSFQNDYFLPVDSVSLSSRPVSLDGILELLIQIFPSGRDHFERTGVSVIGHILSNQAYKPPPTFGPFYFFGDSYQHFEEDVYPSPVASPRLHKPSSIGVVAGTAVGGSVLVILLLVSGVYAVCQRRTASEKNGPSGNIMNQFFQQSSVKGVYDHFLAHAASWDSNNNSGGIPQIKGVKSFSFEEIRKYTNNCSETNEIGSGGYGKVYRGRLPNGQLVAIKRAEQGSMQGAVEFKTEIELLSRVHHKYVVKLVGFCFCFEQGEQTLVYEYVPNGTLQDSLAGNSGFRLDWMRRLHIALGAARGFQYLHDLADPPIIHRDIKSNNILLDERFNPKVADFGISKPFEPERRRVTTQVKGTPGYLDPEYYMTQQLTEKSDVYSFGVLLLELITARNPFEGGIYVVKEVRQTIDKSKDLYNLHSILDANLDLSMAPTSLEKFVDLAMRCLEEAGADRPKMSDVVKEIESIMELVGPNPSAEDRHPSSDENLSVSIGASYTSSEFELV